MADDTKHVDHNNDWIEVTNRVEMTSDQKVVVISDQEYLRPCGLPVRDAPDRTYCTKMVGHPTVTCEDKDGYTSERDEPRGLPQAPVADEKESRLVKHARRELEMIGEEQDIIDWFISTIKAYVAYGHSGGSHHAVMPVLIKLLEGENLAALTDDPDEWHHHSAEFWDGVNGIWQNKRNTRMFSKDKGKTYYDVNDPSSGTKYTNPVSEPNNVGRARLRAENFR